MEQLEKARKQGKPHRGVLTKLLNNIEETLMSEPEDIDTRKLKQLQFDLKDKFETVKDLDKGILELIVENEVENEECIREASEGQIKEKVTFASIFLEDALGQNIGNDGTRSIARRDSRDSLSSIASSTNSKLLFMGDKPMTVENVLSVWKNIHLRIVKLLRVKRKEYLIKTC